MRPARDAEMLARAERALQVLGDTAVRGFGRIENKLKMQARHRQDSDPSRADASRLGRPAPMRSMLARSLAALHALVKCA